jgi:hypothetical protein
LRSEYAQLAMKLRLLVTALWVAAILAPVAAEIPDLPG